MASEARQLNLQQANSRPRSVEFNGGYMQQGHQRLGFLGFSRMASDTLRCAGVECLGGRFSLSCVERHIRRLPLVDMLFPDIFV